MVTAPEGFWDDKDKQIAIKEIEEELINCIESYNIDDCLDNLKEEIKNIFARHSSYSSKGRDVGSNEGSDTHSSIHEDKEPQSVRAVNHRVDAEKVTTSGSDDIAKHSSQGLKKVRKNVPSEDKELVGRNKGVIIPPSSSDDVCEVKE